MRLFVLTITLLFSLSSLMGCQTNQLKKFEAVRPGMDKDDVIELMGSPTFSERWKGMDRWTYTFYDFDGMYQHKEIHFFEGNAVYVGEKPVPEVSAETQDKINADSNKEAQREIKKKQEENRKLLDNYEDVMKGNDKVRYLPNYKPI